MAGARPRPPLPHEVLIGILGRCRSRTTIFLGGLSSIPDDLYEARPALRGATPLKEFPRSHLYAAEKPMHKTSHRANKKPSTSSMTFSKFWVIAAGGPANSTPSGHPSLNSWPAVSGQIGGSIGRFVVVCLPYCMVFTLDLCAAWRMRAQLVRTSKRQAFCHRLMIGADDS